MTVSPWLQARSVIDRPVAVMLALVAGPGVAVLAAAVRIADGPPALIRLPRVGRHGRVFRLCKLRTMRAATPAGTAAGQPLAGNGDARVTAVGRGLRRRRLDELPQLLNVALGDMALIGPRPEVAEFVDAADPRWAAVLAARPGIAGATQLLVHEWEADVLARPDAVAAYRADVLPVKLAVDEWYVRSASAGLDTVIVISLLQRFVAGRPTTRLHARAEREIPEIVAAIGAGRRAGPVGAAGR